MKRSIRSKAVVVVALAVAVAAAAAAVVAVADPAAASHHHRKHVARSAHVRARAESSRGTARSRLLSEAAVYLGTTTAALRGDLSSGKTLAEVGDATPGKSAAGLVSAIEADAKSRITASEARLRSHVNAAVYGTRRRALMLSAAASYLGVSARTLQGELRSGKTLAAIASSTPGKSEAGIVQALVAARRTAIEARAKAGAITHAQESQLLANLQQRAQARVERARVAHHSRRSS